jgi:hypothetical protein
LELVKRQADPAYEKGRQVMEFLDRQVMAGNPRSYWTDRQVLEV